jgi:hypothetical protein
LNRVEAECAQRRKRAARLDAREQVDLISRAQTRVYVRASARAYLAHDAALELLDQFRFDEQLGGAASDLVQLFCCARHSSARVDPALRRE